MDKHIKLVRDGYELAAKPYLDQKDKTQHQIPIFQNWLNIVTKTEKFSDPQMIIELGCGSGVPIGKEILDLISMKNLNLEYYGLDLSPKQIELAHQLHPQNKDSFVESEMLQYLLKLKDNSVNGIVSMFSIRHLPRIYHVQLFQEIFRVLQRSGYFLMDCPKHSDNDFTENNWLGGSKMFWSSFSREWTELTLKEVGFEFIERAEDTKEFFGEMESTLYILLRKTLS